MLRREVVALSSQYADGSLMFPGHWVETYCLSFGVWWLIDRSPLPSAQQGHLTHG